MKSVLAAEAMPEEKYSYRPAEGKFKNEKPQFGPPKSVLAEQVNACRPCDFAFSRRLDGAKPPEACDQRRPGPRENRNELLTYCRDSFAAHPQIAERHGRKKYVWTPSKAPMPGPNAPGHTRRSSSGTTADHYGQMTLYLRENGIVPPSQPA